MLNMAELTKKKINQLWAKCAAMVTKVENIMMDSSKEPSPFKAFYGKKAPYAACLKTLVGLEL